MQVPEKLSLIGGSILLASTLIFTLKSQASTVLPKLGHSITSIYDHIDSKGQGYDFGDAFQDAQKNSKKTGAWGTAQYYIDDHGNMHVGSGHLNDTLFNAVDGGKGSKAAQIRTVSFDGDVQAPKDSNRLLANMANLTAVHGTDHVDTSAAQNFLSLFSNDTQLVDLDLSSWDTSQVEDMNAAFSNMPKLTSLSVSGWNTSQVNNMDWVFYGDHDLRSVDLSHWNTSQVTKMNSMFDGDASLARLDLANWDTSRVGGMGGMFNNDTGLHDLNIPNFNTNHDVNVGGLFNNTGIDRITTGGDLQLWGGQGLQNTAWHSDHGVDSAYPSFGNAGTWTRK